MIDAVHDGTVHHHDADALLRLLASRLENSVESMTERWHTALEDRLRVRPGNVFPSHRLLDGMPGVVRWVAGAVGSGRELDAETLAALRTLAEYWRDGGYSIEETLVHIRILAGILIGELRSIITDVDVRIEPLAVLTAASRLMEALDAMQNTLVGAYRDAEEDRFEQFSSLIAHQVRNHLSTALAGIQLARRLDEGAGEALEDGKKRREVLGRVEQSLEKANSAVEDVRMLSRAQSGDADWNMRPLPEVVEEVVEATDGGDGPEIRIADLPPARVPAEALHVVLHNLVDNSRKYRDPDREAAWVEIHGEWRDARDGAPEDLVIHVGDNGLGIDESEKERIFQRFRRGESAPGDGFGLGLAIVQETVRGLGGRVMLESEPGQGSTFSVSLPKEVLGGDGAP